jgi:hypothetical protein
MIFLSAIVLFDEYLIVDHLGEIEKFIDFSPIFISKKPGWRISQICSEKVWGWASPRGPAHGLSNITLLWLSRTYTVNLAILPLF